MNVRNKCRICSKIAFDQSMVFQVMFEFAIQVLSSQAMKAMTSQRQNGKRIPIEIFKNVVLHHDGESRQRVDNRRHDERGTRDTCDVVEQTNCQWEVIWRKDPHDGGCIQFSQRSIKSTEGVQRRNI